MYKIILIVILIFKLWMRILFCVGLIKRDFQNNSNYKNNKIKILSLNLFMRPWFISDNQGDFKNIRLDEFINNHLNNYDIICLQEVYATFSFYCYKLINKAIQFGFHYYDIPNFINLFSIKLLDSGLLILSRYPIISSKIIAFEESIYSDSFADKSFQYVQICIDNNILQIINTHLQSDYIKTDIRALNIKLKQVNCIKKFIVDKNLLSKGILIILGDFNIDTSYYDLLLNQLDLYPYNDCILYTYKFRHPTLYCTYRNNKEIDTIKHKKTDKIFKDKNIINIARSVDYCFLINDCIKNIKYKCFINKLKSNNPKNKLKQLSDHYSINLIISFPSE